MVIINLKKPFDFDGKGYSEIRLDFDSLSGADIIGAERQFFANGANQSISIKEFSKEFQAYIAARAAKLPVEFFFALSVQDFTQVTLKVQNFFLEADLED